VTLGWKQVKQTLLRTIPIATNKLFEFQ
jgi:hypothetical protein